MNTSASCVLINQAEGKFSFHPLPRIAQAAPVYGVILVDFNADGLTDICLAQNFYHAQPEIGPLAGGLGQLLSNQGGGQFDPVPAKVSGLSVWQDARSLSVTDLNDDGWPDLFFGVNDGEIAAFENAGSHLNHMLNVHVQGPQGNPTAIGAYIHPLGRHSPKRRDLRRGRVSFAKYIHTDFRDGRNPCRRQNCSQVARWQDQ